MLAVVFRGRCWIILPMEISSFARRLLEREKFDGDLMEKIREVPEMSVRDWIVGKSRSGLI